MKTAGTFPGAALRKVYNLQKRNKSNNYTYIQFHARFLIILYAVFFLKQVE